MDRKEKEKSFMDKWLNQPKLAEEDVTTLNIKNVENSKSQAVVNCFDNIALVESNDPVIGIPKNNFERNLRLQSGPCQPKQHVFPKTIINNKNRSFNSSWFEKYNWLEYSIQADSVFCFACRGFPMNATSSTGSKEDTFVTLGFKNWNKIGEKLQKHDKSHYHQYSMNAWKIFSKQKPINELLDETVRNQKILKEKQVERNREYMTRLVNIIKMLVKGGKPLRGHNETEDSTEKGLFLEVVSLLKQYDPFMTEYFKTISKNCTYLSNRIQNDILSAMSNVLLKNIANGIKEGPVSLIADESSDVGHHEQMSVVVRYIPQGKSLPVERFICLQRIKKCDAETIFNELVQVVRKINVTWDNIVAVCFDGAANMAGEFTGVQARCKEMNPSILYVHCYAHCLNLALVSASGMHKENPLIFDFFGTIQYLFNFIEGSPKRHCILEDLVKSINATLKTLKSLSNTRWACRAESVSAVKGQYDLIVSVVEIMIAETTDSCTRAKGKGLIDQLKSFNFIICLEIMEPILQMILTTSKQLQSVSINLNEAMITVQSLSKALQNYRNDEAMYDDMYSKVVEKCDKLEIEIPRPRKRKIPRSIDYSPNIENLPLLNKKDEIKYFTFYPILDSFEQTLNSKFSQETTSIIDSLGRCILLNSTANDHKIFSQKFDLKCCELEAEIKLLKARQSENYPPVKLNGWLDWLDEEDRRTTYFNYRKMLQILSVIPVTSCSCERSFSKLALLKTKLRSTMTQNRLSYLMLPYVEQTAFIEIDVGDIIDEFKKLVPYERRMLL